MRKADYAALAKIIKAKRDGQGWMRDFDPNGKHVHAFRLLTQLAEEFAAVAHVDRAEFLKACGLAD